MGKRQGLTACKRQFYSRHAFAYCTAQLMGIRGSFSLMNAAEWPLNGALTRAR